MKRINVRIPLISLFLLLAMMTLLLTLYSAKIYDSVVKNDCENNTAFVAATYITEKIKQTNSVTELEIDNNQIIIHTDTDINTIVYLYNNQLYETTIYADKQPRVGSGEILFDIKDMKISKTNGLLHILITDFNGNTVTKRMALYEE